VLASFLNILISLIKSAIFFFKRSISPRRSLYYDSPLFSVDWLIFIFSYKRDVSAFLLINYVPRISRSATTNSYSSFILDLCYSLSLITKCNLLISPIYFLIFFSFSSISLLYFSKIPFILLKNYYIVIIIIINTSLFFNSFILFLVFKMLLC